MVEEHDFNSVGVCIKCGSGRSAKHLPCRGTETVPETSQERCEEPIDGSKKLNRWWPDESHPASVALFMLLAGTWVWAEGFSGASGASRILVLAVYALFLVYRAIAIAKKRASGCEGR